MEANWWELGKRGQLHSTIPWFKTWEGIQHSLPAEPGSKQWQQQLWGCGLCPSALHVPRPPFKGVTHVFWCARWMQLNICPCSGSVLYMVGYCQKINQQQSISKCGLQLLSLPCACKTKLQWQVRACACPGAHKSCVQGHCLPGTAAWLQRLPQASNPALCAPHALGTFAPIHPDAVGMGSPQQAAGAVLVPTPACHSRE